MAFEFVIREMITVEKRPNAFPSRLYNKRGVARSAVPSCALCERGRKDGNPGLSPHAEPVLVRDSVFCRQQEGWRGLLFLVVGMATATASSGGILPFFIWQYGKTFGGDRLHPRSLEIVVIARESASSGTLQQNG
jgi:hypothetical protein